jgi:DUF4097 and DUF4098 domain-containing protein YvlB
MFMLASLLVLAGCDLAEFGSSNRYKEDFHHAYPLKAGGRIYLENFNGTVEITGWNDDSVEVSGTKYAATEELLEALRIDIVPSSDSIRIRTARPSDRRGNMGARYVLRVPRKSVLERIASSNGRIQVTGVEGPARLRTSNGAVRATDLSGNLEVRTSNGSVEVQGLVGDANLETSNGGVRAERVNGAFQAVTSNGGIDVTLDALAGHELEVRTSNSGITLRLPPSINARVKADTSNGSISSDFDVQKEGSSSRTHLEGTIGSGGPLLHLSTSNGSIRLEKNR